MREEGVIVVPAIIVVLACSRRAPPTWVGDMSYLMPTRPYKGDIIIST